MVMMIHDLIAVTIRPISTLTKLDLGALTLISLLCLYDGSPKMEGTTQKVCPKVLSSSSSSSTSSSSSSSSSSNR
eukprot:11245091-Heterocapsa_arctica.AAC.1